MISVIICSVSPERLARVQENISSTIGVEFEVLYTDNRGTGDGICTVYNRLACEAKYPVLCFMHEDIRFDSQGWGATLGSKALEAGSGVIGFAGSAAKSANISTVIHKRYAHTNFTYQAEGSSQAERWMVNIDQSKDFTPVVVLDGMFLLVSRSAFDRVGGFDDTTFTGFHLYDLDLSTSTFACGLTNYVCNRHEIVHFSRGDYNQTWYQQTLIYNHKWGSQLPMYVETPSESEIRRDEQYIEFAMTYHMMKRRALTLEQARERVLSDIRQYPWRFKSYFHYYCYLRYRMRMKNTNKN